MSEILLRFTNEYLASVWCAALPWLQKACEYNGEWTTDDLAHELSGSRAQLWLLWDEAIADDPCRGAMVTRIEINAKGQKIGRDVVMAAADLDGALRHLDMFEEFFRSEGCTHMRIHGRKGWAKRLKDYRLVSIVLEKELTNG